MHPSIKSKVFNLLSAFNKTKTCFVFREFSEGIYIPPVHKAIKFPTADEKFEVIIYEHHSTTILEQKIVEKKDLFNTIFKN